ncbi:hypothetical protein ACFV98_05980 [Streptomyces violascens]|uniref:hypothetical protein n=1 Tax=Streptomyces violascens TaxID=67381 RepID=UPI00365F2F11
MNTRMDTLERLSPLWEGPALEGRWVIWHVSTGESLVFDRELNIPCDVDDVVLGEVIRRMREAGAPETGAYPGRPCG